MAGTAHCLPSMPIITCSNLPTEGSLGHSSSRPRNSTPASLSLQFLPTTRLTRPYSQALQEMVFSKRRMVASPGLRSIKGYPIRRSQRWRCPHHMRPIRLSWLQRSVMAYLSPETVARRGIPATMVSPIWTSPRLPYLLILKGIPPSSLHRRLRESSNQLTERVRGSSQAR